MSVPPSPSPASAAPHRTPGEPGETSDAARRRALGQIAGLDAAAGLRNTGGRLEGYVRVLKIFVANHLGSPQDLRLAIAQSRLDEARRIAHMLKGASRTLGLTGIGHLAEQLETDAVPQAGLIDTLEAQLQAFDLALRQTFSD